MKKCILSISIIFLTANLFAQVTETIILNAPDMTRGYPVMQALSLRSSANDFDTTDLNLQDLSDLMWAANGINRPDEGKRTAPSAINAQDIDVYVVMKTGTYLYNAKKHTLGLVEAGDYRKLVAGKQDYVAKAPVICLLVSDISRFKFGEKPTKMKWAEADAGIVSQNISIFCASVGLKTRPRASMDKQKLREKLQLSDTQFLMLNNPVSY